MKEKLPGSRLEGYLARQGLPTHGHTLSQISSNFYTYERQILEIYRIGFKEKQPGHLLKFKRKI